MVKLEQTCQDQCIEGVEQMTHVMSASSISIDHDGGQNYQKNGGEVQHNGCEAELYVLSSHALDKYICEVGPAYCSATKLRTIVSCGAEWPRRRSR